MGKRTNKYREVDKLPDRAKSVQEYADAQDITDNALYNQWRRRNRPGTLIQFEIVLFKGKPFVVPDKK